MELVNSFFLVSDILVKYWIDFANLAWTVSPSTLPYFSKTYHSLQVPLFVVYTAPNSPPKLSDRVWNNICRQHDSSNTENIYKVKQYNYFHKKQPPQRPEQLLYLIISGLFNDYKNVAEITQDQAFNSVVFLYGAYFKQGVGYLDYLLNVHRFKIYLQHWVKKKLLCYCR